MPDEPTLSPAAFGRAFRAFLEQAVRGEETEDSPFVARLTITSAPTRVSCRYSPSGFRLLLGDLSESWLEVQPSSRLRALAEHNLAAHPPRAADAFQLGSALIWCGSRPRGRPFVCLDERLRTAASCSGFAVLQGMPVSASP